MTDIAYQTGEGMSTALAVTDRSAGLLMPAYTIAQALERRKQFVEFTTAIMVKDQDYGVIPGTKKPTLLKPGAEKLISFFGLTPRMSIAQSTEDWAGKDHGGEPFLYYIVRCSLFHGANLIAEGDGSCNSWETKYRWRKADRSCPVCNAAAIRKSNYGGWYCPQPSGGCNAKFEANDQRITSQEDGRKPNPDIPDIANTILKMASKRALIAACLIGVNASEYFTQDTEDFAVDAEYRDAPREGSQPAEQSPARPAQQQQRQAAQAPPPTQSSPPPASYNRTSQETVPCSGDGANECSNSNTVMDGALVFSRNKWGVAVCQDCQRKRTRADNAAKRPAVAPALHEPQSEARAYDNPDYADVDPFADTLGAR